jgi:hypothetical protein
MTYDNFKYGVKNAAAWTAMTILESAQMSRQQRDYECYLYGYNEASALCLNNIQSQIDALMSQMQDKGISQKEQFWLSKLYELKAGTERQLRGEEIIPLIEEV